MNNPVQNYKKNFEELTKTSSHIESFSQVRLPKLSNLELVALNLTAEYMSYNSELQIFRAIKGTELNGKIEHSNYNKHRRKRKRIETLISQLDDQFSMNVNFAKTFDGLITQIISKIAALTMIQYLHWFVFYQNMNNIKVNIC